MSHITVNTSEYELLSLMRGREEVVSSFMGSLDAKRPQAWTQFGYKEKLCFEDFYRAYKRGGAGHGAVHRIIDGCWVSKPRIKQKESDRETDWEKSVNVLFESLRLWAKVRDVDRRNLVGRYSAAILRVADGKTLDQPVVGSAKLVDLVPLWESQIRVDSWQQDQAADDFGKPTMFEFRTRSVDDKGRQAQPEVWAKVHPSRVLILAEGAPGDDFFEGVPLLEAGFNNLVDLEKIAGGSAEGFLKNSSRTISFEYDANASPRTMTDDGKKVDVRAAHEEQVRRLNRNIDSAVVTQGAKAGVLQTTVSDPSKPFEVAANLFAASIRLPFTIVFGQQTGRLASDEDKQDAISRYSSRRENELTPFIKRLVDFLQSIGEIDAGDFEIEWSELGEPTDTQKADLATKLASAAKAAMDAGIAGLFDENELRKAAGYEERANGGVPVEGGPSMPTDQQQ